MKGDSQDQPAVGNWLAELSGEQLSLAGESAAVFFRGLDTMRGIQARTAQQVAQRHAAAAATGPGGGLAMLATQGELLRQDTESIAHCWQELASAGLETNAELWARAVRLVNTEDALGAARFLFRLGRPGMPC